MKTEDWKPWFGGPCPVDENTTVEVMRRNAFTQLDAHRIKACNTDWLWLGASSDIIAYRVINAVSPRINWRAMPVDTLVKDGKGHVFYFESESKIRDTYGVLVFPEGRSSRTSLPFDPKAFIENPKLATNQPWNIWTGGPCPVDENIQDDYKTLDLDNPKDYQTKTAKHLRWNWIGSSKDIIAWRISDTQDFV